MTRREDLGWHRETAVITGAGMLLAAGVLVAAAAQPDRAAFDRAAAQARLRSQPTYQHAPVLADFDGVVVNLHAVVAYAEDPTTGRAIVHPGGVVVPVDYDTFDAVARRSCRVMTWRPDGP